MTVVYKALQSFTAARKHLVTEQANPIPGYNDKHEIPLTVVHPSAPESASLKKYPLTETSIMLNKFPYHVASICAAVTYSLVSKIKDNSTRVCH